MKIVQQIIRVHIKELQTALNGKLSQLRSIYDNISVHIRGLEALGVPAEKYGFVLIPVKMNGIPYKKAVIVARKTTEDVWNINEILETIHIELEGREFGVGMSTNVKDIERGKEILINCCLLCFKIEPSAKNCWNNILWWEEHIMALCDNVVNDKREASKLKQPSTTATSKGLTSVLLQTANERFTARTKNM